MRIGEFAKVCNTKISVLRHYDKQNLLKPVLIDKFSGYRYYSQEQIATFYRITALKQAGFSLNEIAELINRVDSEQAILELFDRKKKDLLETLHNLEEAKKIMLGVENMLTVSIDKDWRGLYAKCAYTPDDCYEEFCEKMDRSIEAKNYQRITGFECLGDGSGAVCGVVSLEDKVIQLCEDIQLPFENDEAVIGQWEAVGEFVVEEEFYEKKASKQNWYYEYPRVVYFLPEGESYWCYSWTKGKLLIDDGREAFANDYKIEQIDNEYYMFVSFKGYDYRRGGVPKLLVLRKVNSERFTAERLARKDDIDLPFVNDERVLGKWKVFDFILTKEEFSSEGSGKSPIFFKEIEFFEGGSCTSIYGEELISGDHMQVWTKGYVLRKWNCSACAYEIRTVAGKDFLIIEWKSGDYRWGGFPTDYYVFVREG